MPPTSRAVLVAAALLASASLAQAGDRGAFAAASPDERVDLTPIVKPAPEAAASAAPVVTPDAPVAGRTRRSRRVSRFARRAPKRIEVAAAKAAVPAAPASAAASPVATATSASTPATAAVAAASAPATAPVAAAPAPGAPAGQTEAAAPTPSAPLASNGAREAASGTVAELLAKHAQANGVPLKLAQAVVRIESRGNVRASNGGALGLMQIKYGTARAAGFSGPAMGLLVADTNLRYGMKILGEAYRAAGGDTCGALMRYQSGHYATHMNRANRIYCTRARALMAGA